MRKRILMLKISVTVLALGYWNISKPLIWDLIGS